MRLFDSGNSCLLLGCCDTFTLSYACGLTVNLSFLNFTLFVEGAQESLAVPARMGPACLNAGKS